jgi:putative membrane protein
MIVELITALILGILIGTLTGLIPGIHINLVSAILLSISTFLLSFLEPITLVIFLVALSITHIFIDFIPTIFLGAPDEDNYLSILPGHEMLIKGEAYSAIILSFYGALLGLILILFMTPLFLVFLPKVYLYAKAIMPFILLITIYFLIYFEKTSRFLAFIIFLLSGFLGIATFNLPLKESLLPLFTGLFGISSLITSITKKQKIPEQQIKSLKEIKVDKKSFYKVSLSSLISSPLCSFLPGLGSGQAAIIGSQVTGDLDRKEFLILLGSINTIVTGLSFVTLFSINKSRTGVAVAISEITKITLQNIFLITFIILISGIISFFLGIFIAKIFSRIISKINYSLLSIVILFFLVLITYLLSGTLGLLILLVSTSLGLTCIYLGVRRTHLMGCLLLPTLLLYL